MISIDIPCIMELIKVNLLHKIRFRLLFVHQNQGRVQSALFFDFGGDNAGQHTARFIAQGAQVCKANLMSRIKAFASTLCLNPYPPVGSAFVVRANDPIISTTSKQSRTRFCLLFILSP